MAISASDVAKLRKMTGAGMMDCKKALGEANGSFEDAVDILRKKGLEKAAKKSDRNASQGLISVKLNDESSKAVMVEVNCETDFVARNDEFKNFTQKIVEFALDKDAKDVDTFKELEVEGSKISDKLTQMIAKIGENMNIKRLANCSAENGVVEGYTHFNGKIGVIAVVSSKTSSKNKLKELGKELCLQVASQSPKFVSSDEIPQEVIAKEKEIYKEQLLTQGSKKPENIIEKIIEGKIKKYFKDVCLLEQPYIREPKKSVSDVVEEFKKEIGDDIVVEKFERFELGE